MNAIADRFATACDTADGGREVRDLADEMVLDVIGALRGATLVEIAEAVVALEARRKTRSEQRAASRKSASRSPKARVRVGVRSRASGRLAALAASGALASGIADSMPPQSRRDPFDITKPGELLDTEPTPRREEERAPASARQVRLGEARTSSEAVTPKPAPVPPPPPVEPPPPAVVLREGEQLLRVGGSGAVIRRARTA